jgi:hypothetical protein
LFHVEQSVLSYVKHVRQLRLTFKSPRLRQKGSMFNNNFELAIEVDGRKLPEYGHRGRTYIEGRRNYRYQIKFRNSRAERVLVIPTVDGLSVVDGNPATDQSPGYVVQAYSSLTITGWRTSLSEVRAFEFSEKPGSYAGKTAGAQNCGVIGAHVYSERVIWNQLQDIHVHHHHWPPLTPVYPPTPNYSSPSYTIRCDTLSSGGPMYAASLKSSGPEGLVGRAGPEGCDGAPNIMCCSVSNSAPDFNLGTAFGAPVHDTVTTTTFEKAICLATFEIYYSDRDGLMKDGIQVDKTPVLASFPQAFGGFCKPPA